MGNQSLSQQERDFLRKHEREETLRLTEEEEKQLKPHPDALSYKFTPEQLDFFDKNGYLVIKKVVKESLCDEMTKQAFDRASLLGLDPDDYKTWTKKVWKGNKVGFIDIWHLPAYYKIRQTPELYSVFAQLYRTHKLTLALDWMSMKPPQYVYVEEDGEKKKKTFPELNAYFEFHNDLNLWFITEQKFQSSVCLSDCPAGHGGFTCIPGFHKLDVLRDYRERYEKGEFSSTDQMDPPDRYENFTQFADSKAIANRAIEVPMSKGDMVIWSSRLPHASKVNQSDSWRFQCFINFIPCDDDEFRVEQRKDVKQAVENGTLPHWFPSGNSTGGGDNWEQPLHKMPELTELGKKIFGFKEYQTDEEND